MFLNSVDFDASTVKIVRFPSTFEKVNPLDCRSTFTGASGGALFLSMCATQRCLRYTPAVPAASNAAATTDQRAYLAASLLFMVLVKQNSLRLYRRAGTF